MFNHKPKVQPQKIKMCRFTTVSGSIYELDASAKRIRRINGSGKPTERVGADGVWKTAELFCGPTIGASLLILWSYGDGEDGGDRCTITSPVTSIEEVEVLP